MIDDNQLGEVSLLKGTVSLLEDGSCEKMARAVDAMRRKRKKPAADLIVDEILELTGYEGNLGEERRTNETKV